MIKERTFKRSIEELDKIFSFISEFVEEYNVDDKSKYIIELCVEEIFTNMVKYNKKQSAQIQIAFGLSGNELFARLIDHEDTPFDINDIDKVDLDAYIREGRSGGLGLHLIKELADSVDFDHKNGISTITIKKKIQDSAC